jgi:biotin carboxylase
VLKPANRHGSLGTKILSDPDEVDGAWAECTVQDEGLYAPRRGMPLRMLAEQYVAGDEFSVEMVVRDGSPIFANVTGKALYPGPRPVELGHTVPAPLPVEQSERLVADTSRVLAAVGFGSGFVHCEWIVSDGTPYLVECAGRMPGDGIVGLIEQAWKLEIVRIYATVMKGQPVIDELPVRAPAGAAAWFLHVPPGRVVSVRGIEEAQALPHVSTVVVTAAPGGQVRELRSSLDRVAFATACAATPTEALRSAQQAVAAIEVTVEPPQEER